MTEDRPDPFFLPYERKGRCLVEYRCSSPHRGKPCGALMAAIYETPWGEIVTAFDKIPIPSASRRDHLGIKSTVPNTVQPVSFYLDLVEDVELKCKRHRRHVLAMPGDEWRQDASEAKGRAERLVVGIPLVEWASE